MNMWHKVLERFLYTLGLLFWKFPEHYWRDGYHSSLIWCLDVGNDQWWGHGHPGRDPSHWDRHVSSSDKSDCWTPPTWKSCVGACSCQLSRMTEVLHHLRKSRSPLFLNFHTYSHRSTYWCHRCHCFFEAVGSSKSRVTEPCANQASIVSPDSSSLRSSHPVINLNDLSMCSIFTKSTENDWMSSVNLIVLCSTLPAFVPFQYILNADHIFDYLRST